MPDYARGRLQEMLTAFWTHRLPIIQRASPAELAAAVILRAFDSYPDSTDDFTIVDFASGAGGPTPTIERIVNTTRRREGKKALTFRLTDLKPHLEAWRMAEAASPYIDFVAKPVDAADPTREVVSGENGLKLADVASGRRTGQKQRVFRLYCLAFHHFDDEGAKKILESTLDTADGFAIIELQSRHLSSFILMALYLPTLFVLTIFWYPFDLGMLFFTYIIPIIPFVLVFDGVISSLRTRTFAEVLGLMGEAVTGPGPMVVSRRHPGWTFKSAFQMHSFPVGYMNCIVGTKDRSLLNGLSLQNGHSEAY
ncbi:MAG: hypothetical protein M1827_005157 [Pycnora praestabilis]|nr:MAG: hypothetical protein M1827_005157 [Pycnora praestabilis]